MSETKQSKILFSTSQKKLIFVFILSNSNLILPSDSSFYENSLISDSMFNAISLMINLILSEFLLELNSYFGYYSNSFFLKYSIFFYFRPYDRVSFFSLFYFDFSWVFFFSTSNIFGSYLTALYYFSFSTIFIFGPINFSPFVDSHILLSFLSSIFT
jgi:hypothetical protein